jgi:hypothetical protein
MSLPPRFLLFLRVKNDVMNETAIKTIAAVMNGRPLLKGQTPAGRLILEEIRIYAETALKAIPVQNVISDISSIILDLMLYLHGQFMTLNIL